VTRFSSGLVVGKFSPLHRGHELVIRRALADCERVFLLSWSKPELPGYEAERRSRWLERLFPGTERLVLTDESLLALEPPPVFASLPGNDAEPRLQRRFTAWICERVWRTRVSAVFAGESYAGPFADELTRCFREREPAHAGVTAVAVDPERGTVPISGTRIRAEVHAHRRFLSPEVYADFVKRVALLGGESTGKSSLAEHVARELGTLHVAEYGRELWERRAGALRFEDLLHIAEEQVAREQAAEGHASEWLVCDTSPLTTLFYSLELFGRADPALERLAARNYELVALCEPDFPFVQDGTRRDAAFRARQDGWYRTALAARAVPYLALAGAPDQRVQALCRALRDRA
jgi:HTH-type transcriptional regulator, transcriptional repressor of NAD biosynthesis genes